MPTKQTPNDYQIKTVVRAGQTLKVAEKLSFGIFFILSGKKIEDTQPSTEIITKREDPKNAGL